MDPTGTVHAHKLSGTSGSRAGGENIFQGAPRSSFVAAVGQLHSSSVSQQPREGTVSPVFLMKSPWLWALDRDSPTHTRGFQHGSRQQVQTGEGQVRLEASPQGVSEDQSSSGGGSLCFLHNSPDATPLQLEARPIGRSSRWYFNKIGAK